MDVRITGAVKSFIGGQGHSFTLRIQELCFCTGTVTFLMGHNGSGKSVLTRVITGELTATPPHELRIAAGGSRRPVSDVGLLRQRVDENLAGDLTVLENLVVRADSLTFGERLRPVSAGTRLLSRLDDFPLVADKQHDLARSLSLGQRQALSFSLVAFRRQPLLFLDEFLSATDASTSSLLRAEARRYAEATPAAVCIVSHDLALALEDADRILVMKNGRIIEDIAHGAKEWRESYILPLLSATVA